MRTRVRPANGLPTASVRQATIQDAPTRVSLGMGKALAAALPLTLVLGCSGEVELRIFGEAYVEEAIPADAFVDGWSVEFSEFVVSVTDVRLSPGGTVAPGAFVVDLARDSSGRGHVLNTTALRDDGVESVHYRLSPPSLSFEGNATEAQAERLRAQNLALWVEGSAARGGQTVRFSWGLPVDLSFDCPVRTPLRSGDKATVELTIHADHLFVDDLKVNPSLAFDEIARADFDEDGSVSPMELGQAPLSGLTRYQTGGREDIDDLWAFIGAASLTMAHVDGEGTCTPRFVPDDHVDREPPTPDPTRAAAVYAEHCASCHGEDGRGGGPLAAGLIPRATDLTSLQGGAADFDYVTFRIAKGGAMFPYNSSMPAYETTLDETELALVASYVVSLVGG